MALLPRPSIKKKNIKINNNNNNNKGTSFQPNTKIEKGNKNGERKKKDDTA